MFDHLSLNESQVSLLMVVTVVVAMLIKRLFVSWRCKVDPVYRFEVARGSRIEINR